MILKYKYRSKQIDLSPSLKLKKSKHSYPALLGLLDGVDIAHE